MSHDCDTYLQKLHTLMIAYALAGVAPFFGVGDPTKEFVLGVNSTEFVEALVLLQYYFWARKSVHLLPTGKRLAWPQHWDNEERVEWVTRYRECHGCRPHPPRPAQVILSSWQARSLQASPQHSA